MTQETTNAEQQNRDTMVIYCDGSCRPNPGLFGFGLHGYKYNPATVKKTAVPQGQRITDRGYVIADSITPEDTEVTPVSYFDGYGCSRVIGTNNRAEILAANSAIKLASEHNIKKLTVKTDSMYVIEGLNKKSADWVRNRWLRYDGTPVPNKDDWQLLLSNLNVLTQKGVEFDIRWVRGHADAFGNLAADRLANVGSNYSNIGRHPVYKFDTEMYTYINERPAEGYWRVDSSRHPMITQRCFYFNTLRYSQNKGEYFMGVPAEKDELTGKPDAECAISVIHLKEPVPVLEMIREYQTELSGDDDALIKVNVDTLFGKNRDRELQDLGLGALIRSNPKKIDLKFLDDEPITTHITPLLRAGSLIEWLSSLKMLLIRFKDDKLRSDQFALDITDKIYIPTEKKVKKEVVIEQKLRPEFTTAFRSFQVETQLGSTKHAVTLTLGIDIPDRNSLKRLEGSNTKVYCVSWSEAPDVYRYATVIQFGEDIGVWAGFHANLVMLPAA